MEGLVAASWETFRSAAGRGLDALVRPSIPILYFGDDRRYFTSLRKIITVGLNPSCKEFPADDRFQRFPRARNATPDAPALADHLHALRDYFREKPYDAWFRPSFEPILNGLGASYYDGASNTALHTDLFSPLATDPTWSRLGDRRRQLETDGVSLWHRLVVRLTPDVIIISVARAYLDKIGFLRLNEWRTIHTVDRENPFSVEARRVRIGEEKTALLVFGRAANIPFGTVSSHDKQRIGAAIAKVLDE